MLRIGKAARMFDITNRTLRYWEEVGILSSTRTENGYRCYDDENTNRIKQIVLLRMLRMPISDIERLFLSSDFDVTIDALTHHLQDLRHEAAVFNSLTVLTEKLIQNIEAEKNLSQVFSYLEMQAVSTFSELEDELSKYFTGGAKMEYKIVVDKEKKLIKIYWSGEGSAEVIKKGCIEVVNELKQFGKGESLLLSDTTKCNTKFLTTEVTNATTEFGNNTLPYCKKFATVVAGFMQQKSFEQKCIDGSSIFRYFATHEEALNWLLNA